MGLSANEITGRLLIEIPRLFEARAWRNNRLTSRMGRRVVSAGVDGQGDILGIIGPRGRMLQIEVKAGKDRMRESQLAFRSMIQHYGGLYLIGRNVDECLEELDREIRL